jgi:hypothetical protein
VLVRARMGGEGAGASGMGDCTTRGDLIGGENLGDGAWMGGSAALEELNCWEE